MDVVIVGPCGAGKSTLVAKLNAEGYPARAVAQEHSAIPELWRHGGRPTALIVLEAKLNTIVQRRGDNFPEWLLDQQWQRLASARAHADLLVRTDEATADEVAGEVITFLQAAGIVPRRHNR